MTPRPLIITGIGFLGLLIALGGATAVTVSASTAIPSATASASASPSPSGASTAASRLAQLKERGAHAIATRESALPQLAADVTGGLGVTAGDKSNLLGQIQADESGLNALNTTIQADTTYATAHSDVELIVTDYYVFALEAPKVHLVIAADGETRVESLLGTTMPEVQSAITASGASATEKAAAQAAYDDCVAKLAAAQEATSGVSAEVINLQPSGYPGNKSTLEAAHTSVTTARQDLQDCRQDLNSVRQDLAA